MSDELDILGFDMPHGGNSSDQNPTMKTCQAITAGHYNPGREAGSQNSELRFKIQIVIFTILIHLLFYFLNLYMLHLE